MGITAHEIINTASLIIAQRLVRTLCSHCKQSGNLPHEKGCEHCRQGYAGRIGIFELLTLKTDNHHDYMRLREAGKLKVKDGITSNHELIRLLGK